LSFLIFIIGLIALFVSHGARSHGFIGAASRLE